MDGALAGSVLNFNRPTAADGATDREQDRVRSPLTQSAAITRYYRSTCIAERCKVLQTAYHKYGQTVTAGLRRQQGSQCGQAEAQKGPQPHRLKHALTWVPATQAAVHGQQVTVCPGLAGSPVGHALRAAGLVGAGLTDSTDLHVAQNTSQHEL